MEKQNTNSFKHKTFLKNESKRLVWNFPILKTVHDTVSPLFFKLTLAF